MDAADLPSLINRFDKKIDEIKQAIPWARICNNVVQEHDRKLGARDANGNIQSNTDWTDIPDMVSLSGMVLEMETVLDEMQKHLVVEEKKIQNQEQRIVHLLEDVSVHLEYLSSNFPVDFGKSPEKAKTKYGTDSGLVRRKTVTTSVVTGRPTVGRNSRPNVTTAATGPKPNNNPRNMNIQNKKPVNEKPVTAPATTGNRITVIGATATAGKKAPVVKMTKKMIAQLAHNQKTYN